MCSAFKQIVITVQRSNWSKNRQGWLHGKSGVGGGASGASADAPTVGHSSLIQLFKKKGKKGEKKTDRRKDGLTKSSEESRSTRLNKV